MYIANDDYYNTNEDENYEKYSIIHKANNIASNETKYQLLTEYNIPFNKEKLLDLAHEIFIALEEIGKNNNKKNKNTNNENIVFFETKNNANTNM